MTGGRFDTIVVGAGSAGAVIAARLAQQTDQRVLLLEAGPDHDAAHSPASIRGGSFLRAMAEPGRTWPSLTAQRTALQGERRYVRGRGVGGSSAVNAMVAMPGEAADYDEWVARYGCVGWGARDVAPWFEVAATRFTRLDESHAGPITRALHVAEPDTRQALLSIDEHGVRISTNDSHLEVVRGRVNLQIRGDALVDRVLLDGRRAVGVQLVDGTQIEGARVVVSAGAIHSPAILLRSGIERPGVGVGLQDHPSVPLGLRLLGEVAAPDTPAVSAVLRATFAEHHDLQVLAFDAIDLVDPHAALLMGAVMRVHSRGRVRLASSDPTVDPHVDFAMLADERDFAALRAVASLVERIASSDAVRAVAEVLPHDFSDDALLGTVGDYVHAAGTCRMGRVDDAMAVVDANCCVISYDELLVCDASVMPNLPRANTHLPTVMIAERIAATLVV